MDKGHLVRFLALVEDLSAGNEKIGEIWYKETVDGLYAGLAGDKRIIDATVLQGILSDISFENTSLDFKWQFEVTVCNDPENPGWFVNVAFERPDTETGEVGTGRGRKEFIALNSWESGAVKTCWLLVELVVRHELMEAFHYRGKRIFNPHNSVHALASIQ